MADRKDTLEARRWLRQRLAELKAQYPHLKQSAQQARLREALDQQREEEPPWHENRPGTPEDGP